MEIIAQIILKKNGLLICKKTQTYNENLSREMLQTSVP